MMRLRTGMRNLLLIPAAAFTLFAQQARRPPTAPQPTAASAALPRQLNQGQDELMKPSTT